MTKLIWAKDKTYGHFSAQPNNQRLTVKPVTDHGKKYRKAGGLVGSSTSAVRTLCTIIPFDLEA
ncbi:hypothetical protein [Paenibacillus sp. TH7-28]